MKQPAPSPNGLRGQNILEDGHHKTIMESFFEQLNDPLIFILFIAAAISMLLGEVSDTAIILAVILVNSVVGVIQEGKAQKALESLKQMTSPSALIRQNGVLKEIPARDLLPGDIVCLDAGRQVPADLELISVNSLKIEEAALTGESVPVEKDLSKNNKAYMSTNVTYGRGEGVVTAIGMDTEIGKIARLINESPTETTPLQQRLGELGKFLSIVSLLLCALLFFIAVLQKRDIMEMLITAISLAVAAVPEGLPAIVTMVLALSVSRMVKVNTIVKRLPSVETLGCVSVVCSDKTGTLTQNRMTVQQVWLTPGARRRDAMLAGALCSDARLAWKAGAPTASGDPTEGALVVAAARDGVDQNRELEHLSRVADIPFDSTRKLMTTIHTDRSGGWTAFVKGAPDVLLDRCVNTARGPVTQSDRARILAANEEMAGKALRVIAVARRELSALPQNPQPGEVERELTFLGLFGLMDPPRPEVRAAVARCHLAGVRPVMITGDHRATAVAVAKELDIVRPGDWSVTGAELDFMPQELLENDIEKFAVFARVSPEHKMRIVQAWQKRGRVVAMTGDGVNDAPALKAADIGCAMGKTGTDVAKGAADMILTDDNFSTIVAAIEEGRGIYSNIRKAIHYLLSCNIGEIFTIFAATLLGFGQMPLVPVQLLWLNLVTDSLPALALGVEPVEEGVMEAEPRDAGAGLFDRKFSFRLAWQGLMVGGLTLTAYFLGEYVLSDPGEAAASANTMAFATLTLCQLFHAFDVRSERASLLHIGVFSNPAMNKAFLAGLVMQLSVLCIPPLQRIFGVVTMNPAEWAVVLALAVAPVMVCEAVKALERTNTRTQGAQNEGQRA